MSLDGRESEELLRPPRPLLSRHARQAVLALLALGVAIGVSVYAWPNSSPTAPVAGPTPVTLHPGLSVPPSPSGQIRSWPTGREACGSTVDLPLIQRTAPAPGDTGISVLVATTGMARVDFDTGRVKRLAVPYNPHSTYVSRLVGRKPTFAVLLSCDGLLVMTPQLSAVTPRGVLPVMLPREMDDFVFDGARAWGIHYSTSSTGSGQLIPLGGDAQPLRLPPEFGVRQASDGLLVGNLPSSLNSPGSLLLVDESTGAVRANLGDGELMAADSRDVIWSTGCNAEQPTPCRAHRRNLDTGLTTDYRLPRAPGYSAGSLSPDGRMLAFVMERSHPDRRFNSDHPFPPGEVAVLNLISGHVTTVPGIELPAKTAPGLAFTSNDWLVIALDAGRRTRLFGWRHGMRAAFEGPAVTGASSSPPGLVALT
jgi:hypothetical protein